MDKPLRTHGQKRPLVQAHRGYSGRYPENTLLAFEKAVEAGVHQIELDIRAAKDGTVFVLHDAKVDRTTDGIGSLHELTAQEVKALDAGAWYAPQFRGERIPTLAETLDALKDRVRINIEVKVDRAPMEVARTAIERALEEVNARAMFDQVVFSSFSLDALYWVKRLHPQASIALLDWDRETHLDRQLTVLALKGQGWLAHPAMLSPERVKQAHERGLFIISGGGNDEATRKESVQRLCELGVDYISTNFPAEVVKTLKVIDAGLP